MSLQLPRLFDPYERVAQVAEMEDWFERWDSGYVADPDQLSMFDVREDDGGVE